MGNTFFLGIYLFGCGLIIGVFGTLIVQELLSPSEQPIKPLAKHDEEWLEEITRTV